MKTKLFFVLLGALAFAACSTDSDEQSQQPPQKTTYPLTIEVTENPLIQDGAEGSKSNRAAITTGTTLNEFYIDYMYNSTSSYSSTDPRLTASKDGDGKWTSTVVWPDGDATINWYASTNGTFQPNGGTPYVNFTVDENASAQKDLLVATASGTYDSMGGKVAFNFNHACAAVRFYIKKAKDHTNTLNISSVVLKNVIKQGKYYFGTGNWDLSSVVSNYTLSSGINNLSSDAYQLLNGNADNSYLFLIPQELTGWNGSTGTYVEIAWTYNSSNGTAKVPLTKTLVKGKIYDIKINIGNTTLTTLSN